MPRIFSSLRDGELHPKYKNAEFKIINKDGLEFTENNIDEFYNDVKVFNSEYIRRNLKWDTNESLDSIAFDVGENVDIRANIEANNKKIDKIEGTETIKGRREFHVPAIEKFEEFENRKFSDEAKRIKFDIFNGSIEFNKGHLKKIKRQIETNIDGFIIKNKKEIEKIKNTALAKNDKEKIDDIKFSPKYNKIFSRVKKVLAKNPHSHEIIEVLENNIELYNWAKQGYKLHKDENLKKCSFCGNTIDNDRFKLLYKFFSDESAKLRNEIEECRQIISDEINSLEKINIPKSRYEFTDKCQKDITILLIQWDTIVKNSYKRALENLNKELERKEKGNIFNSLEIKNFHEDVERGLNDWILKVQKQIDIHNNFLSDFAEKKDKAHKKLIKHIVASFLKKEDYFKKEEAKEKAESYIQMYKRLVKKLKKQNNQLETKLKDVAGGRSELNKYIKSFLNREDITIEVTKEQRFSLKRGAYYAENLSEGEKTAISFAYFLVTLESLHRQNKLKDTIIFIDDPISSLDANHIAQIYSLINSFFFRKEEDTEKPEKIVNCFKQLFISTHNFDFFSFLKDSKRIKNKEKGIPDSGCGYYLIRRESINNANILPLPKSLKLKSEYVYLFEILYRFYKNGCPIEDNQIILIPNALRRFLEIYTLIKLPDSNGEIDTRISQLMGHPHNLKLLHHFSHFTAFENVTKHDQLLMSLPDAMEELISILKHDKRHFESLKRAIKES